MHDEFVPIVVIIILYLDRIPLLEITIEDSAWETFPADSDTLQHTITPELMDDKEVLHQTCKTSKCFSLEKKSFSFVRLAAH